MKKSIFCLINVSESYEGTNSISEFITNHPTDTLDNNRPVVRIIEDNYEVTFANKQYTYSRKGNRWDVQEDHDVDVWCYGTSMIAPYELERIDTTILNFVVRTIPPQVSLPAPSSYYHSSELKSTYEFGEHFAQLAQQRKLYKIYEIPSSDVTLSFMQILAKDIIRIAPYKVKSSDSKEKKGPIKAIVNFFKKDKQPSEQPADQNINDNHDDESIKKVDSELNKALWGSGMESLQQTLYYAVGNEKLLKKFIADKSYEQVEKVEHLNLHPVTVAILYQQPSCADVYLSQFEKLPSDPQELLFVFNTSLNQEKHANILETMMKKLDKSQVTSLILSNDDIITSKAFLNNNKVFQWAVSHGLNVLQHYKVYSHSQSLLGVAANHGAFDTAQYILSQHPSDEDIVTSITSGSGSPDFQLKCLDAINDTTLRRSAAESVLVQAAGNEKRALVDTLLKKYLGGKTESKNALYSCCAANHKFDKEIAEMLLAAGAPINGISLLPCALDRWYTNTPAVKWLLEHGADPNERETRWNSNLTPLHRACEANLEVVKLLVKYGANTNTRVNGKTPKQHATNADISDFLTGITYPFDGIPSLVDTCVIAIRKNLSTKQIQKSKLPNDLKVLLDSNKFQGVSQATWGSNLNEKTKKLLGWFDYIPDSNKRVIFMQLADNTQVTSSHVIFPSQYELGLGNDTEKLRVEWQSKDAHNSIRWSKYCFNLRPFHKTSIGKTITSSDLEADREMHHPVSNGSGLCTFGYIDANYHTWNERFSCTGLKNWKPVLKKLGLEKQDYYPFGVFLAAIWWWGKLPGEIPKKNADVVNHDFFQECKKEAPEWFQQTLQAWL